MLTYGQLMVLNYKLHSIVSIRLGIVLSLIFFAFHILLSCSQSKNEVITIIWSDSRAVGISIPATLMNDPAPGSEKNLLSVQLENSNGVKILGEYSKRTDSFIFTPVVPFTRGFNYEIFFRDKQIGKINIPQANSAYAPSLVAVYPAQDTLPENLLKLYFQFSGSMREGESQQHIVLLNDRNDTMENVFLNLQPELWNSERTVLTIWLDPGRIKRDLIPNQQMGNPLQRGKRYTLRVSANWKDIHGLPLTREFKKQFIVGARDSISPNIDNWLLELPLPKTKDPLVIRTREPLDFFLLQETIQIVSNNAQITEGHIEINNDEATVIFIPDLPWDVGKYTLQVDSHLEDLAGNNLNKLFDRDITVKHSNTEKAKYERSFVLTPIR